MGHSVIHIVNQYVFAPTVSLEIHTGVVLNQCKLQFCVNQDHVDQMLIATFPTMKNNVTAKADLLVMPTLDAIYSPPTLAFQILAVLEQFVC